MSKKNISGIYAITNKVNGKKYVGSSKSVYYRWRSSHVPNLNNGNHHNRHLQAAWKKYGEDNFEFNVLEECKEELLLEREGCWIERTRSWEREFGYNFTRIVDGKQVLSEESRKFIGRRISESKIKDYWTTGTNADIIDLFKQGVNKNAIAIKLGITRSSVYSCLEQNGLHVNTGAGAKVKLTREVRKQVEDLREEGRSWEEIVDSVPVSQTQLHRANAIVPDGKYHTVKVNRKNYRTLTPEVREKAEKLRGQGKTWKEIGKELGVSRQVFYWNGLAAEQTEAVRKKITPEMIERATELRRQGISWKQIGEQLGCSKNSFRKYLSTG